MQIVVVGHLSRDLLITTDTKQETLGGGTAYASLAPKIGALGAGIVTRVGEDFEQTYMDFLKAADLDLTGLRVSGPKTTRFINKYDNEGNRIQQVEAIAPPIRSEDYLPQHLNASIIHFSPLTCDEIHASCISTARMHGSLTSLDVQGYLRQVQNGEVVQRKWSDWHELFSYVDVLKADDNELRLLVERGSELSAVTEILNYGPRIVVVTRNRLGSTVYTRNTQVDIPLILASTISDSTGCGDTYIIGFLLEYMRCGDVKRAGLFGATCASFNLESVGPYKMPTHDMVEERMRLYL